MPFFERDDIRIYYEIHGEGFPVILIAPGGMHSSIPIWEDTPWDPIAHLAPHYRVIAMDQRNAGQSTAPIRTTNDWQVYTEDQLALLDHLKIERFHVAGMCIGGPYIMGLIQVVPKWVVSAVLFQSIGLSNNRHVFFELFDSWAEEVKPKHASVDKETWETFRQG